MAMGTRGKGGLWVDKVFEIRQATTDVLRRLTEGFGLEWAKARFAPPPPPLLSLPLPGPGPMARPPGSTPSRFYLIWLDSPR